MPKPNYKFEKRQKDLARQKKQEEKQQRKALKDAEPKAEEGQEQPAAENPGEGREA